MRWCGRGSPAHDSEDATELLAEAGVLVGGFQTFEELVNSDPRCSTENPMLTGD